MRQAFLSLQVKYSLITMGILEQFFEFMSNPWVLVGVVCVGAIIAGLALLADMAKRSYKVLYLQEAERLAFELDINEITPKQLKTNDNKRFIRNGVAYTLKRGLKTIILWLGKVGTAYTWKPADTPEGKAKIIGTLYDGLLSALGAEIADELTLEAKEKLIASKIFVTVELEQGITPDGLPSMSEQDINNEANNDMASLIGMRIRNQLRKTDFTRDLALIGSGGLALLLLQGLGILPAFTP